MMRPASTNKPVRRSPGTKARLFLSPLDGPIAEIEIREATRLTQVFPDAEVFEWFSDGGCVRLNGHIIPPEHWPLVTVKPVPGGVLDLIYVPAGKKTVALLATVALVAATAAITAGFAAPFLGAAFAAGTLGSSLLAAGVGIAGSLAIAALTAPPKSSNRGSGEKSTEAGASGNAVAPLEPLPVVFGKIGTTPPYLAPPYTVWDGDDVIAYAAVGVQGRCLIENVKVNGIAIEDIAGATYETREGVVGADARTMFLQTVIEERDGVTLSNFKTKLISTKNDQLADQTTPDDSSPKWHPFRSAGTFTELLFRFAFPAGIVYTASATPAVVALEIEMRKIGDVDWRRLPVFYIADQKAGEGLMRAEIRIKREKPRAGRYFCYAGSEYPVYAADNESAPGKTFTRLADDYFGTGVVAAADLMPTMAAATTSGVTFSASSENSSGTAAWKAGDGLPANYWRPTNNSLPAWLKVDMGSAQTIKSYFFVYDYSSVDQAPTHAPTAWYLEGSNDNATWVAIDDPIDVSDNPLPADWIQIKNFGSYRYLRWTFTANNGAANQELHIAEISLHDYNAPGCSLVSQVSGSPAGIITRHPVTFTMLCRHVHLDERGAIVYLDPDEWAEGEYDIRIRRGWAFRFSEFDLITQEYNGSTNNAFFLDYQLSSGLYKIYAGQKNYRSDMMVEAFQTIDDEMPFDDAGVAMIALGLPNAQISSIYAEFTRYASEWDGTTWIAEKVPTQNAAAHYRDLLLGEANAKPAPGESIDETGLADWFEDCEANGYFSNALMSGARVGDAKQMIAAAGYASPRDADLYGVIQDKDTTAEPVRFLISPANSKDEGTTQELIDVPDAIRAEFNDQDQNFAVDHMIIYRDGKDASTARLFETVVYQGITDRTKVEARARFDLRQSYMRQVRYQRRIGREGIMLQRGMLVGLADDVIDRARAAGWIIAVGISGGNVVSITLDNVMPWGASADIETAEDITSITDLLNPSIPMGVAIQLADGDVIYKQVSDVSDSNVCTFTTPFADDGTITRDLHVIAGAWSNVVRRCKIISVVPDGIDERVVTLVDEAPGLYS